MRYQEKTLGYRIWHGVRLRFLLPRLNPRKTLHLEFLAPVTTGYHMSLLFCTRYWKLDRSEIIAIASRWFARACRLFYQLSRYHSMHQAAGLTTSRTLNTVILICRIHRILIASQPLRDCSRDKVQVYRISQSHYFRAARVRSYPRLAFASSQHTSHPSRTSQLI